MKMIDYYNGWYFNGWIVIQFKLPNFVIKIYNKLRKIDNKVRKIEEPLPNVDHKCRIEQFVSTQPFGNVFEIPKAQVVPMVRRAGMKKKLGI